MAFRSPLDEKKLVADLQNEKTAAKAFSLLMDAYTEPLYWHIRKMVANHDDANDLLQNVFLKTWRNIHNFRGDAKLSTWLFKIAINESLNFLNQERQKREMTDSSDGNYLIKNIESDPHFDGEEIETELLKAVAALPEKQRLVFNMRYYDEMKYEEISDILGTSVGALKASYHHAVKKVLAHIDSLFG